MKVRMRRRPLFWWATSGQAEGCWVLCGGPMGRYPSGGVLSGPVAIAMMLGDAPFLERQQYQWLDTLQQMWRSDWPSWLWPTDPRPAPPLVLELAKKDGVEPRLASNVLRRRVVLAPAKQLRLVLR